MSTSPYWIDFTDSQRNSPFVIKVNSKSHDVWKSPQGHFKYKIAIIILKNSKKIKNVRKKECHEHGWTLTPYESTMHCVPFSV